MLIYDDLLIKSVYHGRIWNLDPGAAMYPPGYGYSCSMKAYTYKRRY